MDNGLAHVYLYLAVWHCGKIAILCCFGSGIGCDYGDIYQWQLYRVGWGGPKILIIAECLIIVTYGTL
jgi:hypothetical protein